MSFGNQLKFYCKELKKGMNIHIQIDSGDIEPIAIKESGYDEIGVPWVVTDPPRSGIAICGLNIENIPEVKKELRPLNSEERKNLLETINKVTRRKSKFSLLNAFFIDLNNDGQNDVFYEIQPDPPVITSIGVPGGKKIGFLKKESQDVYRLIKEIENGVTDIYGLGVLDLQKGKPPIIHFDYAVPETDDYGLKAYRFVNGQMLEIYLYPRIRQ